MTVWSLPSANPTFTIILVDQIHRTSSLPPRQDNQGTAIPKQSLVGSVDSMPVARLGMSRLIVISLNRKRVNTQLMFILPTEV